MCKERRYFIFILLVILNFWIAAIFNIQKKKKFFLKRKFAAPKDVKSINESSPKEEEKKDAVVVVVVSGAKNSHLNGAYIQTDRSNRFPTYHNKQNGHFLFQWVCSLFSKMLDSMEANQTCKYKYKCSYAEEGRWYLSSDATNDNSVDAYIVQQSDSITSDSAREAWHENWEGRWLLNPDFHVQQATDAQVAEAIANAQLLEAQDTGTPSVQEETHEHEHEHEEQTEDNGFQIVVCLNA
ncbi:hypothetical protein RFI_11956 [Reticulomyxa filosa]|uniref:Uncharacterized protein n=1 Tax=Reticulomyxa filosa TaxID=46433 RepID=X6NHF2_RETFI|nr:hypothetical protein RFI_11956 [Reticulomyxa filosa]|eukprot:ETO25179.1 hypothetical protein RFI_11956 [Reticulomyxa filosa]